MCGSQRRILSCHVGSRDGAQVVGLGSRCLFPLSHLTHAPATIQKHCLPSALKSFPPESVSAQYNGMAASSRLQSQGNAEPPDEPWSCPRLSLQTVPPISTLRFRRFDLLAMKLRVATHCSPWKRPWVQNQVPKSKKISKLLQR